MCRVTFFLIFIAFPLPVVQVCTHHGEQCISTRSRDAVGRAGLSAESRRIGDQVRQQVIATLGRLEDLQASGQLQRLLRSGARFAARMLVLETAREDPSPAVCAPHRAGLVFERLWSKTGCLPGSDT